LSQNKHKFGKLTDPSLMGLASCQVQVIMSLMIIMDSMLDHETLFVYSYDF
jgi:hypothetical protein